MGREFEFEFELNE